MPTYDEIIDQLTALRERIAVEDIGDADLWQGADIKVVTELPPESEPDFYPDPLFVRTRFPRQLSWLLLEIRDLFGDWIDFGNKFFFYHQLAEAAIIYSDQVEAEEEVGPLLVCVLDEAGRLAAILWSGEDVSAN